MTATYERSDAAVRLFLEHETPQIIHDAGGWNEGPCLFPGLAGALIWSGHPQRSPPCGSTRPTGIVGVFRTSGRAPRERATPSTPRVGSSPASTPTDE